MSDDSCPFFDPVSYFPEYELDFNNLKTRNYFGNEHLMIEKRSSSNFVIPFMVFVYFKMAVILSGLVFDRRPTIFLPFLFLDKRLRHRIWSNSASAIPWLLLALYVESTYSSKPSLTNSSCLLRIELNENLWTGSGHTLQNENFSFNKYFKLVYDIFRNIAYISTKRKFEKYKNFSSIGLPENLNI